MPGTPVPICKLHLCQTCGLPVSEKQRNAKCQLCFVTYHSSCVSQCPVHAEADLVAFGGDGEADEISTLKTVRPMVCLDKADFEELQVLNQDLLD